MPLADLAELLGQSAENVAAAIRSGAFSGRLTGPTARHPGPHVALTDANMLSIPGLVPRFLAFLACLRCGFDPRHCPDPRIARAVACVPANLKRLSHAEVLDVARRVGRLIGYRDDYRRELAQLRSRLRRHRAVLGELRRALDRWAQTGQLPRWSVAGAPGIRIDNLDAEETSAGRRGLPRCALRLRSPPSRGSGLMNLGRELDYPPLHETVTLPFDASAHVLVLDRIRKHVRRLRTYLERLGLRYRESYPERYGRRLDLGVSRQLAWRPRLNVFVRGEEVRAPDLYLGLIIDRSGSMEDERLRLAIAFGMLLAEAARSLPGITGHVSAYSDETFYQLGDFRRNAIAALQAGGGTNDAGALARAAELALASGKRRRLLVMVSDGEPTTCTFAALQTVVQHLTTDLGILCAHVAVAPLRQVAFPHHLDLSRTDFDAAVAGFGRLLMKLTRAWR